MQRQDEKPAGAYEIDRKFRVPFAPDSADRRRWLEMLGGRMVIVATPLQDCIKRIDTDPLRDGMQERMARNARDWWTANEYLSTKRAQVFHVGGFDC